MPDNYTTIVFRFEIAILVKSFRSLQHMGNNPGRSAIWCNSAIVMKYIPLLLMRLGLIWLRVLAIVASYTYNNCSYLIYGLLLWLSPQRITAFTGRCEFNFKASFTKCRWLRQWETLLAFKSGMLRKHPPAMLKFRPKPTPLLSLVFCGWCSVTQENSGIVYGDCNSAANSTAKPFRND